MRVLLAIAAVVAATTAACLPRAGDPLRARLDGPAWEAGDPEPLRWHVTTLPANGLRIVVLPEPSAPTTTVVTMLPVGGKDDPAGKAGLAHLAEHAVFLKRDVDGRTIAHGLDAVAVWSNATTSAIATTFYTSVLPGDLDAALALHRRLVTDPCELDPARFAVEREVVLNELRVRGVDDPAFRPSSILPGLTATAGTEAEVAALSIADVCGFLDAHYAVNGAVLVIAGPVEVDAAIAAATVRLGDAPARELTPPRPPPGLGADFSRIVTVPGAHTRDRVLALYRVEPETAPSPHLLPFLADRLRKSLLRPSAPRWIDDLEVLTSDAFGVSLVVVQVDVRAGARPDPVELAHWISRSVNAAAKRGRVAPPDATWLRNREDETQLELESLIRRADHVAAVVAATRPGDPQRASTPFAMSAAEAAGRLRQLVEPGSTRIVVMKARPAGAATDAGRLPVLRRSEVHGGDALVESLRTAPDGPGELRLPADPLPGRRTRSVTLPNGLPVYLEDTGGSSPATAVVLAIAFGDAHGAGDARAVETRSFAPTTVARESRDVTDDATYIVLQDVSRDLPSLLQVARELAFRPDLIEPISPRHAIRDAETRQRYVDTDPHMVMRRRLFGADHPYGRTIDVTRTMSIGVREVETLRRRHYRPDTSALYVVGRFDLDRAEAQIRHYLGGWNPRSGAAPALEIPPPRGLPGLVTVADGDAPNQVSIRLGFRTPVETDKDRPYQLLLVELLRARAMLLRERQGLAYAPGVEARTLRVGGTVVLEAPVDPRHVATAVTSLEQLVDDLRTRGPSEDELARAKRAVVRRILAGDLTSRARATALAERDILGRRLSDDALLSAVAAATPEDVVVQASSALPAAGQVVVLTGKPRDIAAATAALGRKVDEAITRPRRPQ